MKTSTNSYPEFFDTFPLFDCLSNEERKQIASKVEFIKKKKFSYIYLDGDKSDVIYFLSKGVIKVGLHFMNGKEIIKSIIHPQAMFGELCLIGETHRQEFAQVLKEEVHLFAIKKSDFKQLMRQNYTLADTVMSTFGNRLIKAESKLESIIFKDARTRIIEFIKDNIKQRGKKIGLEMLLKHSLTHQDIASITCTSRQTVTLVLNELKKNNLIYFNRGKILVRDMAKLA